MSPDIISNALPWIQDDNDASHVGLAGGKYEMDGQQAGVVWMDGQQMWSVYETDRRTGRTAKPEEQGGPRSQKNRAEREEIHAMDWNLNILSMVLE